MGPLELIHYKGLEALGRFYGTYRAVVINNQDETNTGKILVNIPMIQSGIEIWASPKSFGGGLGYGFKFLTPPKGEFVWVEFEYGDPARAVWSYHPWARGEMPDELKSADVIGIVTPKGHYITLNEAAENDEDILTVQLEGGLSVKASTEKVYLEIPDGSTLEITKDNVLFNGGNNEGLINIKELTDKLNQLIDTFNNHTHTIPALTVVEATTTKPSNSSSPGSKANKFNQSDYEDTKIKH